ncbi:MAG: hypothetical protein GXY17_11620 [Clostridiaceae bacterium]|jgi:hypothetical protein|nr:hypothetical protein [Clostridiaceae bacterium]NLV37310.1 hypothetical protein [Clostridiaceae bacterium]
MKAYIKPVFEIAQVSVNERIAQTSCVKVGSCFNSTATECKPDWTMYTWNQGSY